MKALRSDLPSTGVTTTSEEAMTSAYSVRLESAERNMPSGVDVRNNAFPVERNRERFRSTGSRACSGYHGGCDGAVEHQRAVRLAARSVGLERADLDLERPALAFT